MAERNLQRKEHHQRLPDITKGKLDSALENFAAMFGVISYIILGKTEDSENFITNHSVKRSLHHKKELSRTSRVNKMLEYFWLSPRALASKENQHKRRNANSL